MSDGVRSIGFLVFFLAVCIGIGWLSSYWFPPGDWYAAMQKPDWNPPDAVFGPVWTALYVLMALAAWLVWRQPVSAYRDIGLRWWWVQLVLNAGWSAVFFGLHRPGWALAEIALLWLAILITLIYFWHAQRIASFLMMPYLAWVSFAGVLNFTLWRLNGGWF